MWPPRIHSHNLRQQFPTFLTWQTSRGGEGMVHTSEAAPSACTAHFQRGHSLVVGRGLEVEGPWSKGYRREGHFAGSNRWVPEYKAPPSFSVQADLEWEMRWQKAGINNKQDKLYLQNWNGTLQSSHLGHRCLPAWGLMMQYPKCVGSENISTENRERLRKMKLNFINNNG